MPDLRLKVNQLELQVCEIPGKGDALIFLHFSGANLMMWSRATPYFQNCYRLILVDLRGHGLSAKPETGYHMDTLADDILGVMETLHIERAHLVGSSLGAEVGLSLAANHPERTLSLVCDGALSSEFGPYSAWEGSHDEYESYVANQLAKLRTSPDTIYPSLDALVEASRKSLSEIGWWNEAVEAMERYGAVQVGEGEYTQSFTK
jgi:2-succinyl-6-hydroxy-2,4-cyclohexadiene-1-carboxylate synthase